MCKKCDINTELTKQCIGKCGKVKSLFYFYAAGHVSDGHRSKCKECEAARFKNRTDKIRKSDKIYIDFQKCRKCEEIRHRDLFSKDIATKTGLMSLCKICVREEIHNPDTKEYRKAVARTSRVKNKNKINAKNRIRRQEDPILKLRSNVSKAILNQLKRNSGSKNGCSIMKYLSYDIPTLKKYIEEQWINDGTTDKSWMNWENHGLANKNKRTWHIDHIIPQSKLPFDSMEHPNFLKCWSLDNLQPLEAIENCTKKDKIVLGNIIKSNNAKDTEDIDFPQVDELKSA